jgi:hypothetical protein
MAGLLTAAELTAITATVQASLDVTLPQYRATLGEDTSGHETETYNLLANVSLNIIKPTATQLQAFADLIGSQRALVIRVMQTQDVAQGDRFVYDSLNWRVQALMDAESYTVTKEFLMSVVVS